MTCDSDTVTTISPILGTIVGGFIGYFVSVKVSDRKEFQKSAAEFHSAFLDAMMSLDQRYFSDEGRQSNVYDILKRTF